MNVTPNVVTPNLRSTSSLRDLEEEDFIIENDPSVINHVDNVNNSASNESQAEIDDPSMLVEFGYEDN